ncbi:MAG TPA: 6-hydroxymethylpterin diphosphokinase MptE-like protein [Negativicutes bacterium]|nr:6-hydroxymethylpterin diphosphokinase MptE-like protein [Negativicutes bacterium]
MKNYEKANWEVFTKHFGMKNPQIMDNEQRVEVLPSRTGDPTARIVTPDETKVFLHSSIDPKREAYRLAASTAVKSDSILVVYGFGLGYLVEALLETTPPSVPIVVVEPDNVLFSTALKVRDLRDMLINERIHWIITENIEDVKSYFYDIFEVAKYGGIEYIGLPGQQRVYEEYFRKLPKMIKDVVSLKFTNLATLVKLGAEQIINALENLPEYIEKPGFSSLYDRFKNIPVIIVSAGPSLDKNIHLLHEAKGRAVIMAVGTAAKALRKHGVVPDFIITVDPLHWNYELFRGLETEKYCLIADIQAHRQIIEHHRGQLFMSNCASPIVEWFADAMEDKGRTVTGGSVANDAMTAAYKMGANPIVLIGQDLSFSAEGRTHASGTNYEKRVHIEQGERSFYVKANDGGQVLTDRVYYHFLRFFEDWFRLFPDRTYINATEGGAYIEGTQVMTLREVMDRYCLDPVDVTAAINAAQREYVQPDKPAIIAQIDQRLQETKRLIKASEKAIIQLRKLAVACENAQAKEMNKHLATVRKIYDEFQTYEHIVPAAERFIHQEIHSVLHRTYRANQASSDDYRDAIADYILYYGKMKSAAIKLKELILAAKRRIVKGEGGKAHVSV